VDVSAQRGVLAARFLEPEGSPCSTILKTVGQVAEMISSGRFCLAGLDVMEMDVHRVGARLRNGQEDQTGEFVKEFVASLLSAESNLYAYPELAGNLPMETRHPTCT
jgi:hypothetical protein